MRCPACNEDSGVLDSRVRGYVVRRRRRCPACGHRWSTVEVVVDALQKTTGGPRKVPDVHPAVRFLFEELERQKISNESWSRMSRISVKTLAKMRGARIPRVDTLDAALLPLGCELIARRIPTTGRRKADPQ